MENLDIWFLTALERANGQCVSLCFIISDTQPQHGSKVVARCTLQRISHLVSSQPVLVGLHFKLFPVYIFFESEGEVFLTTEHFTSPVCTSCNDFKLT